MAYQDVTVSMDGTLSSSVAGSGVNGILIHFDGSLHASISGAVEVALKEVVNFDGVLDATCVSVGYQDVYVSMYGFLNAKLLFVKEDTKFCPDIEKDMIIPMIVHTGCREEETETKKYFSNRTIKEIKMKLTRYRGDTYPVYAKLGINGDFDITQTLFKMSVKIDPDPVETVMGNPFDLDEGIVEFELTTAMVDTTGSGEYDIQGERNGYVYTYLKDEIEFLDDITP